MESNQNVRNHFQRESGAGTFGIASISKAKEMEAARKIGAQLLSRAVFPTNSHLKKSFSIMDLIVKIEFIMLEVISNLFWSSAIEISVFILILIVFFMLPSELGTVWWFSPHVLRGLIGLLLLKTLPKTHEIIKNANIPPDLKLKSEEIFEILTNTSQNALDHFTKVSRMSLTGYFVLTILCSIIDVLMFIDSIKGMKTQKSPYADITLVSLSLIYIILDIYYLAWVNSLQHRVPPYLSAGFSKAAFGIMDYLHSQIGQKIQMKKAQRDEAFQQRANEFKNLNNEQNV